MWMLCDNWCIFLSEWVCIEFVVGVPCDRTPILMVVDDHDHDDHDLGHGHGHGTKVISWNKLWVLQKDVLRRRPFYFRGVG